VKKKITDVFINSYDIDLDDPFPTDISESDEEDLNSHR